MKIRKQPQKPKPRKARLPKATVQHAPQKTASKLKIFWAVFAFLISISGILFMLHPRYSMGVDERFNPYNPFQNSLVITNKGFFPLRFVYSLTATNFKDIFGNSYMNISASHFTIDCLNSDRETPIDLSRFIHINIDNFIASSLDLQIDIKYHTYIFCTIKYPFTMKETVKFKLKRSHDGKYIWQQNG